jgi:hypothetical protein
MLHVISWPSQEQSPRLTANEAQALALFALDVALEIGSKRGADIGRPIFWHRDRENHQRSI